MALHFVCGPADKGHDGVALHFVCGRSDKGNDGVAPFCVWPLR